MTFYSTGGSIPTPEKNTVKYGGNTACVLIEADSQRLIFDAGTGIKLLGEELISNTEAVNKINIDPLGDFNLNKDEKQTLSVAGGFMAVEK